MSRPLVGTRDVALAVARDVFGPQRRDAQAAFSYRLRGSELTPRDRAFAAELTYGAIKRRRTLDWYLKPYLGSRAKPLPAPIAEALRLGVYQLRFMRGVEPHAAVFETVGAALRVGHRGTAGLVNAILRRFIADAPPPPALGDFSSEQEFLGTSFSVPDWIVGQWRERFAERAIEALAGIDEPPQLALGVCSAATSAEAIRTELESRGLPLRRSEFVGDVLVADERPDVALEDDPRGRYWLQSESSGMPVDLLDPRPGERVSELCSGRGNKSLQIAGRIGESGALACIEIDERRARRLSERLVAAGLTNAAVVCADAREAIVDAPSDAVLVDAPCSGLGILGRHAEARWRKRFEDALRLAPTQSALLASGAARVRNGGRLVYSVCTTDVRECEAVVDAFLAESKGFERASLPPRYREFSTVSGDVLVPPGIERRDGFYVASLQRT